MQRWSQINLAQETTATMLLVHTVAITLYLYVAFILVKALVRLHRTSDRSAGFTAIGGLILLTSLVRAAWLGMVWCNVLPPLWLDRVTVCFVYAGVVGTPIIVSAFYLPSGQRESFRANASAWLHRAMIANAIVGAAVLVSGSARANPSLIYVGTPVTCTLAAILLCFRIATLRNLQVRRRGLVLFASFTSAGLLAIASVLVYGNLHHVLVRRSVFTATLLEFSSLLIVVGMLFVFANLRLADVIVKRVLRVALWLCTALSVWIVMALVTHFVPLSEGVRPQALRGLISIALIAMFGAATPVCLRLLDLWIDRWVFQQPDFDAAIKMLWGRLVLRESAEEVFTEGEDIIRETLSLSAVSIPAADGMVGADAASLTGPGPHFPPTGGHTGPASGAADVLLPLFVEGSVAHWIVLSRGVLRPPLTAMELGFVGRVAAQVQVRLETMLAEERRIQTVRRETAFREELTEAELRALRAQINPHFLFNSLNTIADLTMIAPERAEQMTLRLSAVFRYVLINTDKQFSSLREEIDFARSYLAIEEFRFGSRLHTRIEIEPELLEYQIPTLLLQPLIENALKHGLAPRRSGGTINIVAKSMGTSIALTVADDGVGLRASPGSSSAADTHVGLANIRKRLDTAYQGTANFNLRSREGGGTEAIVIIEKRQ